MRTNKTKEQFTADTLHRIDLRNEVFLFYKNTFLPTLKRFDGKVYNKRFITALQTEAQKLSVRLYVNREDYGDDISISAQVYDGNYSDYERLYCKMVINDDGRIDYDATMAHQCAQSWPKSFIETTEEYRRAIAHYDDYMKLSQEMEDAVKTYNNLPHIFRGNHDKSFLRIY